MPSVPACSTCALVGPHAENCSNTITLVGLLPSSPVQQCHSIWVQFSLQSNRCCPCRVQPTQTHSWFCREPSYGQQAAMSHSYACPALPAACHSSPTCWMHWTAVAKTVLHIECPRQSNQGHGKVSLGHYIRATADPPSSNNLLLPLPGHNCAPTAAAIQGGSCSHTQGSRRTHSRQAKQARLGQPLVYQTLKLSRCYVRSKVPQHFGLQQSFTRLRT